MKDRELTDLLQRVAEGKETVETAAKMVRYFGRVETNEEKFQIRENNENYLPIDLALPTTTCCVCFAGKA